MRESSPIQIRLGTSAFTAAGWPGTFYPTGMKSTDYLSYYSAKFDTVEVDSTFYGIPTAQAVMNWERKTPPGFIFSVKIPQIITHEKILLDCDGEFAEFISTMEILGGKLGPMVFQFPFFRDDIFSSDVQFISRLKAFLRKLPRGKHKFAVEIRNKYWLTPRFAELLREYNVALVLQDQSWMPRPEELFEKFDPVTADFTYIRWLGDRKGIEKTTKVWNRTIVDRTTELRSWVDVCHWIQRRGVTIYAYANNHYSGFGPATVEQFRKICAEKAIETPLNVQLPLKIERTLFDLPDNTC
jgi:uncharacterized protein YecE (DUF72 family)